MTITTESIRANLKITYGEDTRDYTISRLDAGADANSLLLLAEAVSMFQGAAPLDLIRTCEFRLIRV